MWHTLLPAKRGANLKRKTVAVMLAAGFPLITLAEPVYLNCMLNNGNPGEESLWKIALDEAAGTVSYSIPSQDLNAKYPAIFTQDKVTFLSIEISRIDLTITRNMKLINQIDKGKCEIAQIPGRKF